MRLVLVCLLGISGAALASLPLGKFELLAYEPMANPKAVVVSGNARFTVLTPQVIRMEYSNSATFEDRATLAFLHRNTTVPSFTQKTTDGKLVITTSAVELTYTVGQPFSASTLSVKAVKSGDFTDWAFGMLDTGNLLGTIQSLDGLGVTDLNCTVIAELHQHGDSGDSLHCEWGVVSRNGWAIVNDTENQALTEDAEWWGGWNVDDHDLYFFGHGNNYRGALKDFVTLAGKVAMVPRYASGIFWTRWYDFNAGDIIKVVDDYRSRNIPLDVFVLDMDWHSKQGWGGYSFDEHLFPYPEDALGVLKNQGLHLACNLHDDDGVRSTENMYKELADAIGFDTSANATIPFTMVNKSYVYGLQDIVLGDVVKQGMDFWWTDWQQGEQGGCKGGKMNPTFWLDKQRGTEHIRRKETTRGMHLARWGGLGTHRYQIGFSGDVAGLTWNNLAYQPYFSATASNVGFGFWSHDIEGPSGDHEMYVRWVQWASFSGAFRSHDRGMSAGGCDTLSKDSCSNVRVWNVPTKYFEANRDAMRAREALVPYIYTAARQAFDSGVGITRPMYYDYPTDDKAYATDMHGNFAQYMWGDDVMVAPIVAPADNSSMTQKTIFTPVGSWYEDTSGMLYTVTAPGSTLTKSFDLTEVPMFFKAGAVIPTRAFADPVGNAMRQYDNLVFNVMPGASSGSGLVYEDDGATTAYLGGAYAYTKLAYTSTATTFSATVSTSGSYPELPATRTVVIRIVSSLPPTNVTQNGYNVPYSRFGGPNTWTYSGKDLATLIEVHGVDTSAVLTVSVTTPELANRDAIFSGVKGAMQHAVLAKRLFDETRATPGAHKTDGGMLMEAASTPDRLTYLAGKDITAFISTLTSFKSVTYANAVQEVKNIEPLPPPPANALAQYYNDGRKDFCLCGSSACELTNADYQQRRIEGYQPASGAAGAIPLNIYWDADASDNWATTQTSTPAGYVPGDFADGHVFAAQQANTVPLELYYSDKYKDHMTVATDAGRAEAKSLGYTLINGTLGYVYSSDPSTWESIPVSADGTPYLGGVQPDRWSYASTLLANAFM